MGQKELYYKEAINKIQKEMRKNNEDNKERYRKSFMESMR